MGEKKNEGRKTMELDNWGFIQVSKRELLETTIKRRMVIVIENDTIGDEFWNPLIAQSLREYADLMEVQMACKGNIDMFESPNGNKITSIGSLMMYKPLAHKDFEKITEEMKEVAKLRYKDFREAKNHPLDDLPDPA